MRKNFPARNRAGLKILFLQLSKPVGDPAFGQIIRANLYPYPVARQKADFIHPHPARKVGENFMPVFQNNFKSGRRHGLNHFTSHFNKFLRI